MNPLIGKTRNRDRSRYFVESPSSVEAGDDKIDYRERVFQELLNNTARSFGWRLLPSKCLVL